jgi:hypothetical protein
MAPQIVRLWESVLQDVSALAAQPNRNFKVPAAKLLLQLEATYDLIDKAPMQQAHLKQLVKTVQVRWGLQIPSALSASL